MNVGCYAITVVVLILIGAFVGGLLIQYVVEYWASRMKEEPVDAPYWACCIGGVFIGWNIAIPVALVTWIFDLAD